MTASFDLNLLPFHRIKGQEWASLPGLLTLTPPRRTARGREDDRLVIYLTLSGNTPLSVAEYKQTTAQLAQRFYQVPGSLTSAIRAAAENLNQSLVERNLRTTGKGQYIIGRLILGVLRGTQLVFAQCGPTHVFHLRNGETQQVHDPQISGRGLGIGQTTPIYLSQLDLHSGDQLVLCADLPTGWDVALLGERFVSPDALRRKLLSITGDDLNAILVQVQAGKGNLNVLETPPAVPAPMPNQPLPASSVAPKPAVSPAGDAIAPTSPRPASRVDSGRPASRFSRLLSGVEVEAPEAAPETTSTPASAAAVPVRVPGGTVEPSATSTIPARPQTRSPIPARPAGRTGRFGSVRRPGELPEIQRPSAARQGFFRGLVRLSQTIKTNLQKMTGGLKKFLPNLLPGNGDEETGMPSGLGFLAIAIPVIIVTVASLVYTRYGRLTQYEDNYNKAMAQAAQVSAQTSPTDVRRAWDSTIYYLDLADKYQVTQASTALRQQAQSALDNLDGIVRLDFQPAIVGGLDRTVQITRMAATGSDLYLLDSARGSVIRAVLGSQGYEVDTAFVCGPGQYEGGLVGKLIDIEALTVSNIYNAHLIAMDAGGALLYCGFNMKPVAVLLSTPPLGWNKIAAFSIDTDGKNLYVLDPPGNAVWVYPGALGEFKKLPTIFGEQGPTSLDTSVDVAINSTDLYLLFADGHVASCPTASIEGVPMRCSDPVTFKDNRPERQPGPIITDAIFNQMTFAAAPDQLLYMLEPLTRAIYYFYPRSDSLELRGQFRAGINQTFDSSATVMTMSPDHSLFFSTGWQVYYAASVP